MGTVGKYIRAFIIVALVIVVAIIKPVKTEYVLETSIEDISSYSVIVGRVINRQQQPVPGAEVHAMIETSDEPVAEAVSQADGSFIMHLPDSQIELSEILINRSHYENIHVVLDKDIRQQLQDSTPVILADTLIYPDINLGF